MWLIILFIFSNLHYYVNIKLNSIVLENCRIRIRYNFRLIKKLRRKPKFSVFVYTVVHVMKELELQG